MGLRAPERILVTAENGVKQATSRARLGRARLPLLAVAVAVAVERVALGEHHPSDVWAGAMVGLGVSAVVTRLARRARGASAETHSSAV